MAETSPPEISIPRFSSMDWKGRTSKLLDSLETSSNSLTETIKESEYTEKAKEGSLKIFGVVKDAGDNTVKNTHILKIRAEITLREREIAKLKNQFGEELFSLMDRNLKMGQPGGGEAEPELVEVFTQCTTNITALLELRKRKQTELIQIIKPKAICYQEDGTIEDDISSLSENIILDSDTEKEDDGSDFFTTKIQLSFRKGLDFGRSFLEKTQTKQTLKSEISELDKDLQARKEAFGVEMYDMMEYLGDKYEPRDDAIKSLFESFKRQIDVPLLNLLTAEKELEDVRATGSVLISRDEIKDYVEDNPVLWAMLEANIEVGEEQCKLLCVRVIVQLMSGLFGGEAKDAVLKKRDFLRFEKIYVKNAKGAQEFFHRCVFASYDTDNNGKLNKQETDMFLDTLYASGSVTHGAAKLPEKDELKKLVHGKLGGDGNGQLTFEEIKAVIFHSSGVEVEQGIFGLGKMQVSV